MRFFIHKRKKASRKNSLHLLQRSRFLGLRCANSVFASPGQIHFFSLALSHFLYLSLTLSYTLTLTLTHTHTLYLSDSARNEDMGKNDVKTLLLHFVDLILEENTLMVHFDFPKAFLGGSRTQALGSQRKPNEHLILFFNRILVSPMSSQVTIREITFSEFRSISFFEKKTFIVVTIFSNLEMKFFGGSSTLPIIERVSFPPRLFCCCCCCCCCCSVTEFHTCDMEVCHPRLPISPYTHTLSCTGSQACARTPTHTYAPLSCCSSLHPVSLSLSSSHVSLYLHLC